MTSNHITHACPHCSRTFSISGHLTRHIRSHTNERPHKCPHPPCTNAYARSDNLRRHILAAHAPDQRTHHCPHPACTQSFATAYQLRRHTALHERPHPFACIQCGKTFRKKNQLAIHSSEHTGRLPYPCSEHACQSAFLRPSQLRRHLLSHNLGDKRFICTCGEADAAFANFSQLQKHIKEMHPSPPRGCDQCGKRFRTNAALNRHLETHRVAVVDRLRHVCPVGGCGAAYAQRTGLRTHLNVKHSSANSFTCDECGFETPYRSVLKRHFSVQHGIERRGAEKSKPRPTSSNVQSKRKEVVAPHKLAPRSSNIQSKRKEVVVSCQQDFNSEDDDSSEQHISYDEGGDSSEQQQESSDDDSVVEQMLEEEMHPRKRARSKPGEGGEAGQAKSSLEELKSSEREKKCDLAETTGEDQTREPSWYRPQVQSTGGVQSCCPSTTALVDSQDSVAAASTGFDFPSNWGVASHEQSFDQQLSARDNIPSSEAATDFNDSGFRALTCPIESIV